MTDARSAASDWTDNDLLTITDAIELLAAELVDAAAEVDALQRSAGDDAALASALRRLGAIRDRHAALVAGPQGQATTSA